MSTCQGLVTEDVTGRPVSGIVSVGSPLTGIAARANRTQFARKVPLAEMLLKDGTLCIK
jgi:hypothetical protein